MENIDIYSLLPEEIIELIEKLKRALTVVEQRKNICSKVINKEKSECECPICHSTHIWKNGHDENKTQRYKCADCGYRFNDCSSTVLARTKLSYNQWKTFYECMNNKLSIRKTAEAIEVDKNTVYLLRHKVLDGLGDFRKKIKLSGNIEADEYYESINLKGTETEDMPRFSKPRSSHGGSKQGISNHQVCIASACDDKDNMFFEIVGTGPITSQMVKDVFIDKITDAKVLVTDCKSSYESFAKDNNIKLEQVKSGTYVNSNGYNLANINSLHSELATFLSHFRGVSTKHLQHYLDWFSFDKIINYTVEFIKQPMAIMKKSIVKSCSINTKNMYDNNSGIDFADVYADYA